MSGNFEYGVSLLIDKHLELAIFDSRHGNDDAGRLACRPRILLRVILAAYAGC
jgi:hypothetical protein